MKQIILNRHASETSEVYSGRAAAVVIKRGDNFYIIPNISNFKITDSGNVASWASFGDMFKRKQTTTKDWSGSFDGKLDLGDENGQIELIRDNLTMARTELYFMFKLARDGDGNVDISDSTYATGFAIINTFDITTDAEDVTSVSISFEGDQQLDYYVNGTKVIGTV